MIHLWDWNALLRHDLGRDRLDLDEFVPPLRGTKNLQSRRQHLLSYSLPGIGHPWLLREDVFKSCPQRRP